MAVGVKAKACRHGHRRLYSVCHLKQPSPLAARTVIFQHPRCFLTSTNSPGGNLDISSDPQWLQVCHDNCSHSGDKRTGNNMPQLYHIYMCVRRQRVPQRQGLGFSCYPSAALFSIHIRACTCAHTHTYTHTNRQ